MLKKLGPVSVLVGAILCDLVSKDYVFSLYEIAHRHSILWGLSWMPVYNTGIAWSLGSQYPSIILILSIVLSCVCLFEFLRSPNLIWGLITAGGIANTFDRCMFGSVRDFISISIGGWFFPIFNLADIFLTLGMICLLWQQFFGNSRSFIFLGDR